MSGECVRCGEHTLECTCANNACKMAIKIYKSIYNSNPKIMGYTPDALIRVFVYLAHKNDWTLEETQNQVSIGIKYYYSHADSIRKDLNSQVENER
jgi:predicted nucleic acid-binding Zn finger protein